MEEQQRENEGRSQGGNGGIKEGWNFYGRRNIEINKVNKKVDTGKIRLHK